MTATYIGLGSNLGDRRSNLQQALNFIASLPQTTFIIASSLYESPPIDASEQDLFLNAVCQINTELSPPQLLYELKGIERILGRPERYERWSARCIDLDILFFGKKIFKKNGLTIPHSEIPNRKFVLLPLLELTDFEHPVLKKKLSQLLQETRDTSLIHQSFPPLQPKKNQ